MPHPLPSVLSIVDLPAAELWAARLDGDLVQLGDCFTPVDVMDRPEHRSRAVHSVLRDTAVAGQLWEPGRVIAERRSAAWIWGATPTAPVRQQLCVGLDYRIGHEQPRSVIVREVVIEPGEYVSVGGFRVTTPLRTIIDLARFSEPFDDSDASAVAHLMRAFGISLQHCLTELDRRRNLPGKRRARERLSRC